MKIGRLRSPAGVEAKRFGHVAEGFNCQRRSPPISQRLAHDDDELDVGIAR